MAAGILTKHFRLNCFNPIYRSIKTTVISMSYSEEYIKNKLLKELEATHVVSIKFSKKKKNLCNTCQLENSPNLKISRLRVCHIAYQDLTHVWIR